jgi:DNA-binding MurR/RpiR family transcriptional regulator
MKSIETRIYERYETLSPSERRLADVILEHQRDLAVYTATELAGRAGVSKATAARLFQGLGYSTFNEAKRQVRAMQHWGSPLGVLEDHLESALQGASLLQVMQTDIANIRTTVDSIRPELFDQVVSLIDEARKVWIIGLRNGYGLAWHAKHYFGLARPDVQALAVGSASWGEEFSSMTPGDLLFAIGFRRRPKVLARLLETARQMGLKTVLLTDVSATQSARHANVVLRCHCHSPSPFSSFTAAVTILNFLAWALVARRGHDGVKWFQTVDHLISTLDDVSQPFRR